MHTENLAPSKRLLGIPGVTVMVEYEGKPLKIQPNGFAGTLDRPGFAKLRVRISTTASYIGYDRNEHNTGVEMLRNSGSNESPAYQRTVPILQVGGQRVYYPDSKAGIWLLAVGTDGIARVFLVALNAQESRLFVTYTALYERRCYRDESEKVVCPGMEEMWGPEITRLLGGIDVKLPELSTCVPAAPDTETFPEGIGRIKWYNLRLGIGIVRTANGEARTHWSEAPQRSDGMRYFWEGDLVAFRSMTRRTGHKPTPEFEIHGVSLLST